MIKPTMGSPPITKLPKVSITEPAYPVLKIPLVVEILSESLKTVVISRMVGKDENSSASLMYIVIRRITTEREIFTSSRKSRSAPPITSLRGMIRARTINITNTANTLPVILLSILRPP